MVARQQETEAGLNKDPQIEVEETLRKIWDVGAYLTATKDKWAFSNQDARDAISAVSKELSRSVSFLYYHPERFKSLTPGEKLIWGAIAKQAEELDSVITPYEILEVIMVELNGLALNPKKFDQIHFFQGFTHAAFSVYPQVLKSFSKGQPSA